MTVLVDSRPLLLSSVIFVHVSCRSQRGWVFIRELPPKLVNGRKKEDILERSPCLWRALSM